MVLPKDYNGKSYEIYQYAFYVCDSLTSVIIGDSVTGVGRDAFSNCRSLTSVTIGNSVTSIGDYAFFNCRSLTSVIIGNCVTRIEWMAFGDCDSLTVVYYNGATEEWDEISSGYNYDLTNATRYYYSESQPTEDGNYWHYVDGEPQIW